MKNLYMDPYLLKKSIHELVDKIDDEELLTLYHQLLKREFERDIFASRDQEMIDRAKTSLASVEAGRTRNIRELRRETEAWKKRRTK